jgi:hypothetical protein
MLDSVGVALSYILYIYARFKKRWVGKTEDIKKNYGEIILFKGTI